MSARPVKDDVYKDVSWLPEAVHYAESFGLSQEDCEKILLQRSKPTMDPRTAETGHLIVRYRAGDVVVVVGHRDKHHPVIMSVWVETGNASRSGSRKQTGSGSSLPTTMKQLQRRILDDGFKIKHGGSHLRVESEDGELVATLPSTPSDHRSIPNSWTAYLRKKAAFLKKQEGLDG